MKTLKRTALAMLGLGLAAGAYAALSPDSHARGFRQAACTYLSETTNGHCDGSNWVQLLWAENGNQGG